MNLATKLTLARVIAIPLFMVAFLWKSPGVSLVSDWGKIIATVIFIIAAITDYFDGYLARKYNMVTTFGKFIDPIADKLLVSAALIVMVVYREISYTSAWVTVIIIAREFSVTGLRLICAEKGVVIAASNAGKFKTVSQLVAIITALCFISIRVILDTYYSTEVGNNFPVMFNTYYGYVIYTLMGIATIATIYSGYDYFRKNKSFLEK
jgi:CDP-diacylglycerol--glycerol-3-phosphate 3-phosphatidyltransferase